MNPAFPKNKELDNSGSSSSLKLPAWFRQELPDRAVLEKVAAISELGIRTVCQEARCPNLSFCFKNLDLTFMILGGACTRNCAFCAVGKASRPSLSLDLDEPYRLQEAVRQLGLNYVVITSVTRDDLSDGGADIFAQCVELMRAIDSRIKVEVLIPDFKGRAGSIKRLLASRPDVVAHNLETVRRLYRDLRPMANYQVSLDVLKKIKEIDAAATTKSSLMLGLGETEEEVSEALADLRLSECDILTLGQYLAPSLTHYPIKEFVHPEQFKEYKKQALGLGFKGVLSGPLVRSSYKAEEVYKDVLCL